MNQGRKKDISNSHQAVVSSPELRSARWSVLTCPEKCSTGEKLMPWWAGRLEKSGRGKTSPRKSRCPEPAQWHRRASPARRPADPQRQERQWNSWFLFSCERKSIRTRRGEGAKGRGLGRKERERRAEVRKAKKGGKEGGKKKKKKSNV